MSTMVRKQVYIEPRQAAVLKRLVQRNGITEAEIIRRAIDIHAGSILPPWNLTAWQRERVFIQQLIAQGPVTGGGRDWKCEELYER